MTFPARQNISESDQPYAGRLVIAMLMCLGLVIIGSSQGEAGKAVKATPQGPVVTIHAPHAQQYELALDEAELDWSRVPGAKGRAFARQVSPGSGEAIADAEAVRALVTFPRLGGQAELRGKVEALQSMNPGAEAHLVAYESGQPRSKATRRLLTREVALVVEPEGDPRLITAGLPVKGIRPVAGVAGGYVVDADSPLSSPELAEALRQRPGVKHAYPLLRRQISPH